MNNSEVSVGLSKDNISHPQSKGTNILWKIGNLISSLTGRKIVDITWKAQHQSAWILNVAHTAETQEALLGANIAHTVESQASWACLSIAHNVKKQLQICGIMLATNNNPDLEQAQVIGIQHGSGHQEQTLFGVQSISGGSQGQHLGVQIYDPKKDTGERYGYSIRIPDYLIRPIIRWIKSL